VNENPLDEGDFPLQLVGPELAGSERVAQIVEIRIDVPALPAEDEEAEPEATEESSAASEDKALTITGAVEEPDGWCLTCLENNNNMEVIEVTVVHPSKAEFIAFLLGPEGQVIMAENQHPYATLPFSWRGILAGALMMWARGMSEFGAVVILAYHPKIIPVLVYERFTGFGLTAARPVAVTLILVVLVVFSLLRALLYPRGQTHR